MQEVVALMDVPDGEHMLIQNLKIVASIQGNVLGEEEKTPSVVISTEKHPIPLHSQGISPYYRGFRVIA